MHECTSVRDSLDPSALVRAATLQVDALLVFGRYSLVCLTLDRLLPVAGLLPCVAPERSRAPVAPLAWFRGDQPPYKARRDSHALGNLAQRWAFSASRVKYRTRRLENIPLGHRCSTATLPAAACQPGLRTWVPGTGTSGPEMQSIHHFDNQSCQVVPPKLVVHRRRQQLRRFAFHVCKLVCPGPLLRVSLQPLRATLSCYRFTMTTAQNRARILGPKLQRDDWRQDFFLEPAGEVGQALGVNFVAHVELTISCRNPEGA